MNAREWILLGFLLAVIGFWVGVGMVISWVLS